VYKIYWSIKLKDICITLNKCFLKMNVLLGVGFDGKGHEEG